MHKFYSPEKYLKIIFLTSFLIYGCAGSSSIERKDPFVLLKQNIKNRFNDSLFAHAHWGVLIKSLKDGKIWYEQNSEKMFMPASNEKIPTAAAALVNLGPDFNFETYLTYDGSIQDSVLNGDLIVFGNGDPTLYNKFFDDPRALFFHWADLLDSMGIKKINGNIIGDDNAFEDYPYGDGWSFDGLDVWYSAEIGALQLNENYVDLEIIPPAEKNDSVKIIPNLPSNYFTILNNLTVVDSTERTHISVSREFGTNKIIVSGKIAAGSRTIERSPSITNSTLFYTTVLKETLESRGIAVEGIPIDCDDINLWNHTPEDFVLIEKHLSPPLKEILKGMMKRSQNLYAETMPRILGLKEENVGSFKMGKKVVEETLESFGIKPKTYAYMDGSGLSRYDYISPKQIVKILTGMRKSKFGNDWIELLPIAGVDGTLKNRMKGTKAEGNVKAKTGTISNVRSLSGYITTKNGEELVFSFIVNGHLLSSKDTEDVTDSVLEMIAEYPD